MPVHSIPDSTQPRGAAPVASSVGWLAEEMSQLWRQDERPTVEDLLTLHPQLIGQRQAALDLIYEEIRLRHEYAEEPTPEEFYRRFPQWRAEIDALFDCYRLLERGEEEIIWPAVGDSFGDFQLLSELGRGALGQVFLAKQSSLADRPVALKVGPLTGREHLSLARLQHTHVVPLLSVHDDPRRRLRAVCMPYFGGASLDRLIAVVASIPVTSRTGRQLLDALDAAQADSPIGLPARGSARKFLAQASYTQAVCWIGACLADALQYAHERGLVHMDLKPSNVLLSADGQPMLLDFHLAHEPFRPGQPLPPWMGGTPVYMSPEQHAAFESLRKGEEIKTPIDHRADVYSLGLVLYESLGGETLKPGLTPRPLHEVNRYIPRGLSDIINKCLERRPERRYSDAASLADDLRRQLNDRPLRGVPNRSLRERWTKWRRRRPHTLPLAAIACVVLAVAAGAGAMAFTFVRAQVRDAVAARAEGQRQLDEGDYADAAATLEQGLAKVRSLPGHHELAEQLEQDLGRARRAEAAEQLRRLADEFRFLYAADSLPVDRLRMLDEQCQRLWEHRNLIVERIGGEDRSNIDDQIANDLLDLAILWSDLRVRLAPQDEKASARRAALAVLDQAEAMFGPSVVLYHERRAHAEALGLEEIAREAARNGESLRPQTGWEWYALGRAALRSETRLTEAADQLRRAVELQPDGLWPNYYYGVCAYRLGRYDDAVAAFTACAALRPDAAAVFHNRALAYEQLDQTDRARKDRDRARRLGRE